MPKRKKKKKLSSAITIFLLLLLFLLGVGVMLYPQIAARYSESVRSEIQTHYEEELKTIDTSELDALRESARAYNKMLFDGTISPLEPEKNNYYEELKLSNSQVMCYVSVPRIDVYLPVYHGIGEDVLTAGAGHMPQSSLPVGGENTHTVITAHSGMAQSPMFSDLGSLETGDIFQIIVLGEKLTYEVDNVQVVLPEAVDAVKIQRDKDLASLVTCTPYGVNTHRLVVTGHRIETPVEEEIQAAEVEANGPDNESLWTEQYWQSMKIGAGCALGIIFFAAILYILLRKKPKKTRRGGGHE